MLLCQSNGTWSSPVPTCTRMRCYDFPQISNGYIKDSDSEDGEDAEEAVRSLKFQHPGDAGANIPSTVLRVRRCTREFDIVEYDRLEELRGGSIGQWENERETYGFCRIHQSMGEKGKAATHCFTLLFTATHW